ncbi:MAG TPA: S8 family serine peptidase [Flavobacteriaceae bacterium]|nr:S8 family serine peptidase [Flavobacteriaceae bacterium]
MLIGIVDSKVDLAHEDLIGQIAHELNTGEIADVPHGTGVASLIVGKTNNNKGIASIAHESKLVTTTNYSNFFDTLDEMASYPNVKVINASLVYSRRWDRYQDSLIKDIVVNRNVLVVASAGNGADKHTPWCSETVDGVKVHCYGYPASYDYALSITGVGNRYPIGHHHQDRSPINNNIYSERSWKDVYEFYPHTTTGNDNKNQTRNDKVDLSAPGQLVLMATRTDDDYNMHPSGYKLGTGTSQSSPIVAGVAALVFAANPDLTALQVKDILKNTADDIYHIPYNQPYEGLLGTGRVNAYRAVMTAKCMANPEPGLDLMIRNSLEDYGVEPDVTTDRVFWNSPDIWVRNQDDGHYMLENQNPRYQGATPNYVYVRVTNRSCVTSSGTEELELYWSKANTSLNWPEHWDGSLFVDGVQMGGLVNTLSIPSLEPGEETIIKFPWYVPNPNDYKNINENPWHFCLLSRIVSDEDLMSTPEESFITSNVKNNNNLGWKNVTVVDLPSEKPKSFIGAAVGVNNFLAEARPIQLNFEPEIKNSESPFHEIAEIKIHLDFKLYNAWELGGKQGEGVKENSDGTLLINEGKATLSNILLPAEQYATVSLSFNFLVEEFKEQQKFVYHITQTDLEKEDPVGGEVFEIYTQARNPFEAKAGGDKTIEKNESITLRATTINEDAVYNWYDAEGNLLYSGNNFVVTPDITQKYQLEVIADLDGYKDYDEVNISVNPFALTQLVPNPASSDLRVHYALDDATTSAYITVVHQVAGSSNNYILDVEKDHIDLDISSLSTGIYTILLVADGEIKASKGLIKQ